MCAPWTAARQPVVGRSSRNSWSPDGSPRPSGVSGWMGAEGDKRCEKPSMGEGVALVQDLGGSNRIENSPVAEAELTVVTVNCLSGSGVSLSPAFKRLGARVRVQAPFALLFCRRQRVPHQRRPSFVCGASAWTEWPPRPPRRPHRPENIANK